MLTVYTFIINGRKPPMNDYNFHRTFFVCFCGFPWKSVCKKTCKRSRFYKGNTWQWRCNELLINMCSSVHNFSPLPPSMLLFIGIQSNSYTAQRKAETDINSMGLGSIFCLLAFSKWHLQFPSPNCLCIKLSQVHFPIRQRFVQATDIHNIGKCSAVASYTVLNDMINLTLL